MSSERLLRPKTSKSGKPVLTFNGGGIGGSDEHAFIPGLLGVPKSGKFPRFHRSTHVVFGNQLLRVTCGFVADGEITKVHAEGKMQMKVKEDGDTSYKDTVVHRCVWNSSGGVQFKKPSRSSKKISDQVFEPYDELYVMSKVVGVSVGQIAVCQGLRTRSVPALIAYYGAKDKEFEAFPLFTGFSDRTLKESGTANDVGSITFDWKHGQFKDVDGDDIEGYYGKFLLRRDKDESGEHVVRVELEEGEGLTTNFFSADPEARTAVSVSAKCFDMKDFNDPIESRYLEHCLGVPPGSNFSGSGIAGLAFRNFEYADETSLDVGKVTKVQIKELVPAEVKPAKAKAEVPKKPATTRTRTRKTAAEKSGAAKPVKKKSTKKKKPVTSKK